MRTMQQWFDEYGQSHQNKTKKHIHLICVPLIFFSIIGLLASIPSNTIKSPFLQPYLYFGTIVILLGLLFNLRLTFTIFLCIAAVYTSILWAVSLVNADITVPLWLVSIMVFILAWAGQFYGHKVEDKTFLFSKDLQFR